MKENDRPKSEDRLIFSCSHAVVSAYGCGCDAMIALLYSSVAVSSELIVLCTPNMLLTNLSGSSRDNWVKATIGVAQN
jgi:hypothetical protein